jgi:hypothetical protein
MSCYELIRPYVFQPLLNSFFSPFCSTFYLLSFFFVPWHLRSGLGSGQGGFFSLQCRSCHATYHVSSVYIWRSGGRQCTLDGFNAQFRPIILLCCYIAACNRRFNHLQSSILNILTMRRPPQKPDQSINGIERVSWLETQQRTKKQNRTPITPPLPTHPLGVARYPQKYSIPKPPHQSQSQSTNT